MPWVRFTHEFVDRQFRIGGRFGRSSMEDRAWAKLSAQKRLYRARGAWRAKDDTDQLKRLTRAELIRIISKLETQIPINVSATGIRRGDRSDTFFQHLAGEGTLHRLVEHCLPGHSLARHSTAVINHDERAALVCALTALCVAVGDYTAVGDEDGWIILPPASFVQGWAMQLLRANDTECASGASALYGGTAC